MSNLLLKPLSRQEREVLALRRKGMNNQEIADDLDMSPTAVGTVLCHAKRKGAKFPKVRAKSKGVPIERLVHIRGQLKSAGYQRGLATIIAERVGMKPDTVKVRLWKHDNQQGASQ